jgi:hypothetical protein
MRENLISVLARGNQELFHSAFLAWLLKPTSAHGLGTRFARAVLECLPTSYSDAISGEYEVRTEFREGHSRFDILVRPVKPAVGTKGIVFENKVKSFGTHLQLDAYKEQGYNVAVFALLPETLDPDTRARYPIIEYKTLRELISSMPLDSQNGYHFFVVQYVEFLDHALYAFDLIRRFACGALEAPVFLQKIADVVEGADFSDNDVRTFSYFYYHNLAEYLRKQAPDLWFGDAGKQEKEAEAQRVNTRWLFEKNMPGPPFMEAILHRPFDPHSRWTMHPAFAPLYEQRQFQVAPRLEVWLDLKRIAEAQDPHREVGQIMLGTWSDDLRGMLRDMEPYKSNLKRCGPRNFHREMIQLQELPFDRLAERLRRLLGLLFLRRA